MEHDKSLQCGRIYKDAEICRARPRPRRFARLQCGRIYKDAEICGTGVPSDNLRTTFNVAASIKMRKCGALLDATGTLCVPSMWPHL